MCPRRVYLVGKRVLGDGQWQRVAQWCGAPRSGPLSSMAPRRCLALGHVAVPASGGALRLSLLHGPLEGQPPGPATPNTDTFNMIPCIFQAGSCPPWAMCPCAVSSSSGRPCAPMPKLQGQTGGRPSPTPCPVVVLKLQDNVNLVSLAQQGCCCCCSEPPALPAEAATLSQRGFGHGPGPTRWKDPPPEVGPGVCA